MMGDSGLPFVSIIIPAFNEAQFIRQCLESIIEQEWPDDRMEILVVDNGSTDDTREIAKDILKGTCRGKVLSKTGGTIASVRNYGWKHAEGQWLAFLDGDSVVMPNWLQTGHALLSSADDISCVGFAVSPPDNSSSWVERVWHPISSSGKYQGTKEVCWLSSFNLMLKREMFERVNGFDESLVTCEDADLGYRLSSISRLILSDRTYVKHLGTVKTVKEFFKKERWRGQSNFQSFLCSNSKSSEVLSIMVPFIYLLCGILWLGSFLSLGFFSIGKNFLVFTSIGLVLLPMIMTFRAGIRGATKFISTSLIYMIYLFARGLAIAPITKE